jgi:hypothetical protein
MLSFEQVLSKVAEDAAFDKWPFRSGDSAHLNRWLEDWRAARIWQKLHPGAFERYQAWSFIMTMLSLRQLAEQLDQANERVSDAKQVRRKAARRNATKRLAELRTELSAQGINLAGVRDGALDSVETPEPFLTVRSDEHGTRRRTLFCRLASQFIHAETGRWHDAQVAALCEIALDCEDITTDMIRHAREAGRRDVMRERRRKA